MPNTGQVRGQAFKCDKCRKDFNNVWLPTNVCCKVQLDREGDAAVYATPFSRHFSTNLKTEKLTTARPITRKASPISKSTKNIKFQALSDSRFCYVNSLAPFSTLGKATCGFYHTDNKKFKTGIPPSDLVAWRCHLP